MTIKKKLIEVALPLEAINKASAREKSIRHGHPSTLHLWWARRPLAACRAVLFASLVDDPSSRPDEFPTEEAQERERHRLFRLIEELVLWENSNNDEVLARARAEIMKSTNGNPPPVLDPFCGGGSIPLEAQRLGLKAYASDLNPVAVLITKAMIEIPPRFAGLPPVNPRTRSNIMSKGGWKGTEGLAQDISYYGKWIREEVEKRIGYLYPRITLPKELGGKETNVIAWIWTRTVKCPNPACGIQMPLARSFWLSTKKGKKAWVEPEINRKTKEVTFKVKSGLEGSPPDGSVNRRGGRCICCGDPVRFEYIREEGKAGCIGYDLMAIVADSEHGRVYVSPDMSHKNKSKTNFPEWIPDNEIPNNPRDFKTPNYGMNTFADLFTTRQLVMLSTYANIISEVYDQIFEDAISSGLTVKSMENKNEIDAKSYAKAVATYLGLAVSRSANTHCSLAVWSQSRDQSVNVFSRQALPMTWDFPEVNPFAGVAGDYGEIIDSIAKSILSMPYKTSGFVTQEPAQEKSGFEIVPLISTDPPYYDNISYADLSDFFYIWLRRSLSKFSPELFSTLLAPKNNELIASPYRFNGDKEQAKIYFENGLSTAFSRIKEKGHLGYPTSIYYAFKQTEIEDDDNGEGVASTGWESMLHGLITSGYAVVGTWPMRTERPTGVKVEMNALASSIVLICRPRPENSPVITRREFINKLRAEIPFALKKLQHGNIAPVDMAQASIGPGMAVFSRYSKVLEASGQPMRVRTALQLINQELDAYLSSQEGEMDSDTRFCLAWYEQFGLNEAPYGEADVLARAKDTAVNALVQQGILSATKGKVQLLKREDLSQDWILGNGPHESVWLYTQQLVRKLEVDGEEGSARLAKSIGADNMESVRNLAYRLYAIAERKGWADEAFAYNSLIVSWSAIETRAAQMPTTSSTTQGSMFE